MASRAAASLSRRQEETAAAEKSVRWRHVKGLHSIRQHSVWMSVGARPCAGGAAAFQDPVPHNRCETRQHCSLCSSGGTSSQGSIAVGSFSRCLPCSVMVLDLSASAARPEVVGTKCGEVYIQACGSSSSSRQKAVLLPQPGTLAMWRLHVEGHTYLADAHFCLGSSWTGSGMRGLEDCILDELWLQASCAAAGQIHATFELQSGAVHLSVLRTSVGPTPGLSCDRHQVSRGEGSRHPFQLKPWPLLGYLLDD